MTAQEWPAICQRLRQGCTRIGLDLLQPFSTGLHQETLGPAESPARDRLGVLLGNTRALWPAFIGALAEQPELGAREHPLESYLESRLTALLALATDRPHQIHWAHVTRPRALPIQRLAEAIGFASLAPCHLSIHPVHGPWLALRAVVVIDVAGPEQAAPPLISPCVCCAKPCLPALARALELSGPTPDAATTAQHADAWIAVRDACPVGQSARYSTKQLRYHYRKDPSALR